MLRILLTAYLATFSLADVDRSTYRFLLNRQLDYDGRADEKKDLKAYCKKNQECKSNNCVRMYCKEKPSTGGGSNKPDTKRCRCAYGTAASGAACPRDGAEKCGACKSGYKPNSTKTKCGKKPSTGSGSNNSDTKRCQCPNGTAASGTSCPEHRAKKCRACKNGYKLNSDKTQCVRGSGSGSTGSTGSGTTSSTNNNSAVDPLPEPTKDCKELKRDRCSGRCSWRDGACVRKPPPDNASGSSTGDGAADRPGSDPRGIPPPRPPGEEDGDDAAVSRPKPRKRKPPSTMTAENLQLDCQKVRDEEECETMDNCQFKYKRCRPRFNSKKKEVVAPERGPNGEPVGKVVGDRTVDSDMADRAAGTEEAGSAERVIRKPPPGPRPEDLTGCEKIEYKDRCNHKKNEGKCRWRKVDDVEVCLTNPNLGACEKVTKLGRDAKTHCKGDCEIKAEACVHPALISKCFDINDETGCNKTLEGSARVETAQDQDNNRPAVVEKCEWNKEKGVCWRIGLAGRPPAEKEELKAELKKKREAGRTIGEKKEGEHILERKKQVIKKAAWKNKVCREEKKEGDCAGKRVCKWHADKNTCSKKPPKKKLSDRKEKPAGKEEVLGNTSFTLEGDIATVSDEKLEEKIETVLRKSYPDAEDMEMLNIDVLAGVDKSGIKDFVRLRRLTAANRRRLATSNSIDVEYVLTCDEDMYDQMVKDAADKSMFESNLADEMQDIGEVGALEAQSTPVNTIEEDEDFLLWENWTEGCSPYAEDDCVLNGCYWSGTDCLANEETFDEAVEYEQELAEEADNQELTIILVVCIGGGVFLFLLLLYVFLRCRKRRSRTETRSGLN